MRLTYIGEDQILKIAYKKKKKLDTGTTVYEYTDAEKKQREQKKAKHVRQTFKNIGKIKSQFEKDLTSLDPETKMCALAVGIIYHIYERVGDRTNIGAGVTSFKKKHISVSGSKVTFKYVGKSHVKQEKTLNDAKIAKVIKEALKDKGDNSYLFDYVDSDGQVDITAKNVNRYLKQFNITAKDLRAHAANDLLIERLKQAKKPGSGLSDTEKTKHYKDELKAAIEDVAEEIGHTPGICKSSYIDKKIIEQYEENGTIASLKKTSAIVLMITGDRNELSNSD